MSISAVSGEIERNMVTSEDPAFIVAAGSSVLRASSIESDGFSEREKKVLAEALVLPNRD
jgi:hypothetical protein